MSRPALSRSPLSGDAPYFALEYEPEGPCVHLLEQRELPERQRYLRLTTADEVAKAIRDMSVRGAPAIGIAAAYALALIAHRERGEPATFLMAMGVAGRFLDATRPTAVNLGWAIARMARKAADVAKLEGEARYRAILAEAEAIHREDVAACRRMGELGALDVPEGATVMTHCNAGALATGGWGTALGVIRSAWAAGKLKKVLACETRPYLQGARLTAWELHQDGIPVEVITDSMSGHFFQRRAIDFVVVGADRIAKNGDVANKIGTYGLAIAARAHGARVMVVAPLSTFDPATPDGAAIPIEERQGDEVTSIGGRRYAPPGVAAYNPVFDVTPASLVDVLVTEAGAVEHPDRERVAALVAAR